MFTVINNTTMTPVCTTSIMNVALAWAETVPYQNDFSVIAHSGRDLAAYSQTKLKTFYSNCWNAPVLRDDITYQDLIRAVIRVLDNHPTTSEPPPDEKRVAPLPMNEDNVMPKKPIKATKKVTKKVTKKPASTKVERTRKNGVITPKPDSATGKIFAIADQLSKKAGAPAARNDVVAAGEKAGIKTGTCTAAYQIWRNYNGLVKARK